MRGVVVTRSMFREPITEMTFFEAISMVVWDRGMSGGPLKPGVLVRQLSEAPSCSMSDQC
jgi:hypothetical protein